MNISKDSKELESREKELLKYFPSDYKKPDEKNFRYRTKIE